MIEDKVKITVKEYVDRFVPAAGFALIEKDGIKDQHGRLYVPKTVVDRATQHSSTAVIRALSPFPCKDEHDQVLQELFRVGDRIGVSPTTPIASPVKPNWEFTEKDFTCLIHVADIVAVVFSNEEERREFEGRLGGDKRWQR